MLLAALPLARGASSSFVTVEKDARGVWWFKHGATTFFSRGINHVNNGGQDDGVGGRDSVNCTALSGSISTVLTGWSWIFVGIHSRRALPCPVCA